MGPTPGAFGSCPHGTANTGSATLSAMRSRHCRHARARLRRQRSRGSAWTHRHGGEGKHTGQGTCNRAHVQQERGDMESLTRRASSREWSGHAGTRKTGRRNTLLNLCEFYAERSHRSTVEQDWFGRQWGRRASIARQRVNGELSSGRAGWKFRNFTVTLTLEIPRCDNYVEKLISFDEQLFLVARARPSTIPPTGGGQPLEIF